MKLAKAPCEVELAKVPRESDNAELEKVPVDQLPNWEGLWRMCCEAGYVVILDNIATIFRASKELRLVLEMVI